ncbi:MAG: hypothetical protein MUF53_03135 [Gemmatimonadaceae bacterium]|jgi:hypothetical protein|nr:hypothetical protein [Gemmatimonadaceae bacterium]
MPETLYSAPGVVTCTLDRPRGVMHVTWQKFPGDGHFRPCLEAQMRAAAAGAKYLIADVRTTVGVPSQDDQDWVAKTVFPTFQKHGFRAIVTLTPQSAITKLGAKRWTDSGAPFGFRMFETATPADAEALLGSTFADYKKAA